VKRSLSFALFSATLMIVPAATAEAGKDSGIELHASARSPDQIAAFYEARGFPRAAIEALTDPLFNLDSVQATTQPVAPLIVVNGPIARELSINAGYNAFGQGFRANGTIGRAVRLVLMNVGGGLPGSGDRATQGSPAKLAYCVAENEAESPWEPLHVEAGFPADVSTVTTFGAEGPHNIQDHHSNTARGVLLTVAGAMGQAGSNNLLGRGWPPMDGR
jgi:hypothetical protein